MKILSIVKKTPPFYDGAGDGSFSSFKVLAKRQITVLLKPPFPV
jgi:hypothetical protein